MKRPALGIAAGYGFLARFFVACLLGNRKPMREDALARGRKWQHRIETPAISTVLWRPCTM
jgi:hypothetical protein